MTEPTTPAAKLLQEAAAIVSGDRREQHGSPERTFGKIAAYWSTFLGLEITPVQVAQMMVLLKTARGAKYDDLLDAAGYAALAYEVGQDWSGNVE